MYKVIVTAKAKDTKKGTVSWAFLYALEPSLDQLRDHVDKAKTDYREVQAPLFHSTDIVVDVTVRPNEDHN